MTEPDSVTARRPRPFWSMMPFFQKVVRKNDNFLLLVELFAFATSRQSQRFFDSQARRISRPVGGRQNAATNNLQRPSGSSTAHCINSPTGKSCPVQLRGRSGAASPVHSRISSLISSVVRLGSAAAAVSLPRNSHGKTLASIKTKHGAWYLATHSK